MNKTTARLIELSAKASGISPARAKRLYSRLPHHQRKAFKDGMRHHLMSVAAQTLCYECHSAKSSPVPVIHNGEHGVIYSCDEHREGVAKLEGFTVVPEAMEPVTPADYVPMHPEDMKEILAHDREKRVTPNEPPKVGLPGTEEGDCCNRGGCDGVMEPLDTGAVECVDCGERHYGENYDPTPYCGACGSMTKDGCKCGPIADNE